MSVQIMVTVSGSNQAELVKHLSEITHGLGGKWLNSKICHIDDNFAGLLKVEIQSENVKSLTAKFKDLGIAVDVIELAEELGNKNIHLELMIDAKDRAGLVSEITQVLSDNSIKVENMECNRLGLPDVGGVVFTSKFRLLVDKDFDKKALLECLAEVSSDLVIDFRTQP